MKKINLLPILLLFFTQPSMALFEVRAGYGALSSNPDISSFYSGATSNIPSAAPNAGLTLDAVFNIPFVGLGAGIRSENMKISYDSSALGIENELKRNALIINYRILNTLIYLGPIFTYGLSHSNGLKLTSGSSTLADVSSSKVTSYSLGLEAGASLLGLMVGAEVGTMQMKYQDAKDSVNPSEIHDLNMSGPYAKVFIGFGI